ncbi:MAG: twitching motility protein PilT [Balneolaceae bacterium]|nr:MAG: twitching motility protein PilT [Balneolaceae bacterium]
MSDGKTNSPIHVRLRFYEELNDFLSPDRRKKEFERILPETTTVKDLIEGCGVPHTEVDLILLNGEPADFDRHVADGDRVSVYPVFESLDISDVTRLQERPLRAPRFLVDVNLGKLAGLMRMAGFDTAYRNDADDDELVEQMLEEDRALLTRDRRLLMRRAVHKGCLVRSDHPPEQLDEVIRRFDLAGLVRPFTRCMHCNGLLHPVDKEEVMHRLRPLTKKYYDTFSQCGGCRRVYWRGSHYERLDPKVRSLLGLS